MFNLTRPWQALVLTLGLSVSATSVLAVEDPAACRDSFYCYGSDATPAGAQPVRIVVEGERTPAPIIMPNSGSAPNRAPVPNRAAPAPNRPVVLATTRAANIVRNTPNRVVAAAVVPATRTVSLDLGARPSVLDANAPVPRVAPRPMLRTLPAPRPAIIVAVPPRPRPVATASAGGTTNCGSLMDRASKAESQGVTLAKTGQSSGSRQAFQAAAGFRSQASALGCRV